MLAVLAAGCSGSGDEPVALPTLTAAPSPTATVAPVPLAAQAFTPVGAAAFVRFYFDRLNDAFRSADSSVVRAYSAPSCGTCSKYESSLDFAKRSGIRLAGPSFAVKDVEAAPLEGARSQVEVYGTVPPKVEVDSTGATVQETRDTKPFHFTVIATHGTGRWLVAGIQIANS